MNRRTLLKFVALFPLVGPTIAKALVKPDLKPALSYRPYIPSFFPKWDKAVDGLEEAGKWAIELERARLPSGMVAPRVGQVWETVRDCEVGLRPHFVSREHYMAETKQAAAATWRLMMLCGLARLRQGEKIRIVGLDDEKKPLHVTFQPVRYNELHAGIVPEDVRQAPEYAGYELSVKTAKTMADFAKRASQTYFNEAFRLVEDVD
jgi:hypothetical protein